MELAPLLFARSPLRVVAMRITPEGVTLVAEPAIDFGFCPVCGARSGRVHSHYPRMLQDLPAHGRIVHIELHLCRFFCDLPDCPQHTFAQRLPQVAEPHARKTCRLSAALQETAFTTGGEAGARLAGQLGMPASGDTLLRLLRRALSLPPGNAPRVLGVDDWAMRRGQTYGTILCDLERHRRVDLLPERTSASFAAWLAQHPGAQFISRDRGGDYARGAAQGAPDAVQVADRWHLLHNLTEALQRAVDRRQALLGEVAQQVAAALAPAPIWADAIQLATPSSLPSLSRADHKKMESRNRRLARYQQVQELLGQSTSVRKICRTLKMSRNDLRPYKSANG